MKYVAAIVGSHDVGEVVDHCTANAVDNSAKSIRLVHQIFLIIDRGFELQ